MQEIVRRSKPDEDGSIDKVSLLIQAYTSSNGAKLLEIHRNWLNFYLILHYLLTLNVIY
jgi:hypothetical protein